jgi:hypothetical protein
LKKKNNYGIVFRARRKETNHSPSHALQQSTWTCTWIGTSTNPSRRNSRRSRVAGASYSPGTFYKCLGPRNCHCLSAAAARSWISQFWNVSYSMLELSDLFLILVTPFLIISPSPPSTFCVLICFSTSYAAGYTAKHPTIKWFWSVAHAWNSEQKKRFLAFTTGSDRVPISGLGSVPLVIQRNGPDSDHLPTASTCYNVLLLPEYSSREKVEKLMTSAINNFEGFGLA